MKSIAISLLWVIFLLQGTNAQESLIKLERVNIGDKAPNYPLNNLINYSQTSIKFSDFKGKLLILDFWTFGCRGCVESWPKLLKLQDKFKDKIQILLVNTYEDEERVKEFIHHKERINNYKMTLPVACNDKQLNNIFPHQLVPHVVFIDQYQTVKYITSGSFINEKVIQNIIDNREMKIQEKTDIFENIDRAKPLFMAGNHPTDEIGENILWSTVITPYSNRFLSVIHMASYNGSTFGYFGNQPLAWTLQVLYGKGTDQRGMVPHSRLVFENIDSTKLVEEVDGVFMPENKFTFQATAKTGISINQLKKKMINDIETCFGLETGWKKRKRMCLVISRGVRPIHEYKEGASMLNVYSKFVYINNVTIPQLIDRLTLEGLYYMDYPIVDETNFSGKLGRIEHTDTKTIDYRVLEKVLEKYGLYLTIQEREVDVLVISESKKDI